MVYKQFLTSIRWNTFEALVYQCLLVASQALLFYALPPKEYGLVGILFSITYLIVMSTNIGLDLSLGPLFTLWGHNKAIIKRIIVPHLLVQPLLILAIAIITLGIQSCTTKINMLNALPPSLIILISFLILCESLKKTARTLLHLLFFNRITALIEVAIIALYVLSLLCMSSRGIPLTVMHIFLPLFILSFLSTCILTVILYRWYVTLPDTHSIHTESTISTVQTRITKNRIWNYGVQLGHALFSGNFLVSLFGIQFGLAQAGAAKFANSIAHGIAMIVRKIFDTSSSSYFSHIKNEDTIEKQTIFAQVSSHINELLYSVIICTLLLAPKFFKTYHQVDVQLGYLILLLGAIHIIELFYISYEKFFINEEKSHYLLVAYGIPALFLCVMYYHSYSLSMYTVLLGLLIARIITFISLTFFSMYLWNMRPTISARPKYIAYSLGASLAMLFFIS